MSCWRLSPFQNACLRGSGEWRVGSRGERENQLAFSPSSFAKQQLAGKILGSDTTLQRSGSGKVNLASQTSNTLRKANGQKAAAAVTKNCGDL